MKNHRQPDVWLYGPVAAVLGLTVIVRVAGTLLLATANQSTPEVIVTLGSVSIGGLARSLTPSELNR